jgi:hypothetical protein
VNLSITHKFGCIETEFNIGESREAAPHGGITGRRVVGASKVTSSLATLMM